MRMTYIEIDFSQDRWHRFHKRSIHFDEKSQGLFVWLLRSNRKKEGHVERVDLVTCLLGQRRVVRQDDGNGVVIFRVG